MAGVELTQEQQAVLLSMGFEDAWDGDWRLKVGQTCWFLWSPKASTDHPHQWVADWHPEGPIQDASNPRFDDPITAATWLLIQASNQ